MSVTPKSRLLAVIGVAAFLTAFFVMWRWYVYLSLVWSPKPMRPEWLIQSLFWSVIAAGLTLLVAKPLHSKLDRRQTMFASCSWCAGIFTLVLAIVLLVRAALIYNPGNFSGALLAVSGWAFYFSFAWVVPFMGAIVGAGVQAMVRHSERIAARESTLLYQEAIKKAART